MELSPALRLQDVTLSFRGLRAVDRVSFSVAPREVIGLIGPNGAGKTSVFNLISGIYRPDGGRIDVFGHAVAGKSARRIAALGVGRTFQSLNLFPTMTVTENVLLGRHLHRRGGVIRGLLGLTRRDDRRQHQQVARLLAQCDLVNEADTPAIALSYGAQKRLELARAVAMGPRLLLLDEPAAGMNAAEKQALAAAISRVAADLSCAALVVEHDIAFVRQLSSRLVVLDFGTVIASGEPSEVLERHDVQTAYLGEPAVR